MDRVATAGWRNRRDCHETKPPPDFELFAASRLLAIVSCTRLDGETVMPRATARRRGACHKLRKAEISSMLAGTKSLTRVFYDNRDAIEKRSVKNFILCSKKSVPCKSVFGKKRRQFIEKHLSAMFFAIEMNKMCGARNDHDFDRWRIDQIRREILAIFRA
jgi:hypothetical protein